VRRLGRGRERLFFTQVRGTYEEKAMFDGKYVQRKDGGVEVTAGKRGPEGSNSNPSGKEKGAKSAIRTPNETMVLFKTGAPTRVTKRQLGFRNELPLPAKVDRMNWSDGTRYIPTFQKRKKFQKDDGQVDRNMSS